MISYQKVILKMAAEIDQAKKTADHNRIKEHARAIRLLTDLILDDEQSQETDQVEKADPVGKSLADELELRQMLGANYQGKPKDQSTEDDGQSDSLLDF